MAMLISEPFVEILMATYQGGRWLDVQLASIFAQDYSNWRLLIRDDGSTDDTRNIIRFWRDRFPDKIHVLDEQSIETLGLVGNFSALMGVNSSDYTLFADQDDVWYRDKVSRAVAAISALEAQHERGRPLLISGDLRMVDQNLRQLQPSVLKYRGMKAINRPGISGLFLENVVYGCTLIANRPLITRSTPIPKEGLYVDWWLALVATAFGTVENRREVNLDWRRHGTNTSSLPSLSDTIIGLWKPLRHRRQFHSKLAVNQAIVQAFLDRYGDHLSNQDRGAARAFLNLQSLGFAERRYALFRYRLWFSSWIRNAGLLLLI